MVTVGGWRFEFLRIEKLLRLKILVSFISPMPFETKIS